MRYYRGVASLVATMAAIRDKRAIQVVGNSNATAEEKRERWKVKHDSLTVEEGDSRWTQDQWAGGLVVGHDRRRTYVRSTVGQPYPSIAAERLSLILIGRL